MNQGEIQQNKSSKKWKIIGASIFAIVIVAISVYILLDFAVLGPNPEITLVDGHGGLQGLNYIHYVDVKVTNQGGEGWVKVYAEINGPRYEEQNQRIYMDKGETKQLQFAFDIGIFDALSSVTSKAWAVAD